MRKLAVFSFSTAAAIYAVQYCIPVSICPYLVVASLILTVFSVLVFRKKTKLPVALLSAGICFGLAWSWVYDLLLFAPSQGLADTTTRVTAVVDAFPVEEEYGARVDMRLDTDGPNTVLLRAYVFGDELNEARPGDRVEFTGDFSSADNIDGESITYYTSQGYRLFCSDVRDVEFLERPGFQLRYLHRYAQREINTLICDLFPLETGPFMQALITGDRTQIDENIPLSYAMERTGITHIIAVSGMHVSILAGVLMTVFGRKKWTVFIITPVLFLFMGISGFSASVVRAVIMQMFILIAPFFKRDSDSLTSLSAALLIILLINPYAAAGVGLQLSFGATLGIILFSEKIRDYLNRFISNKKTEKRNNIVVKLFSSATAGVATTVSALIFTMPLSVLYFGYISLVSPIVNLLVLWAVDPAFVIGSLAVAVGGVWSAAGRLIAWIPAIAVKFIEIVVELFAKPFFAGVYISSMAAAIWFIFAYGCVLLAICMKVPVKKLLIPGCAAIFSLCAVLVGTAVAGDIEMGFTLTVLNVGQGQSLVFTSKDSTAVIDCGSSSGENAGEITEQYLRSLGRDRIDLLILTHYHEDHANGVEYLLSALEVGAVIGPSPVDGDQSEPVLTLARDAGTDIIYIENRAKAVVGNAELWIYGPVGGEEENERGLFVLISDEGADVLITGDASGESEIQLSGREEIPDIECLVVGHHGSAYSTSQIFLDRVRPEAAVISVGDNSYGHPSQETLDRLEENNIRVYRTDIYGNVTIDSREMEIYG